MYAVRFNLRAVCAELICLFCKSLFCQFYGTSCVVYMYEIASKTFQLYSQTGTKYFLRLRQNTARGKVRWIKMIRFVHSKFRDF